MSETELIVRYAETDMMKVVHHSVYPIWFEAGRTDFAEKLGYPYSKIEEDGIMMPLCKLECTFKVSARYGDTVIVKTFIRKLTPVRIELGYQIYKKGDNTLLTEGYTLHAWTNTDLKIINLKLVAPQIYTLFESNMIEE